MFIKSQTFSFAPPQPGAPSSMTTQAGTISNVPLDGSQQITVPFLTPYSTYVASVQLTYNPSSDTGIQQAQGAVIGSPTINGFVMEATGGSPGTTGNFTYVAVGT